MDFHRSIQFLGLNRRFAVVFLFFLWVSRLDVSSGVVLLVAETIERIIRAFLIPEWRDKVQ